MKSYRRTKQTLNAFGTLYARYSFKVFYESKRRKRFKYYLIEANDTSTNVKRDVNKMFRNSFKDAKVKLYYEVGGSKPFEAYLKDYTFIYWENESREKSGKIRTNEYYNSQIEDTITTKKEDVYEQLLQERKTGKQKTPSVKKQAHKTRISKGKNKLTPKSSIIKYQKKKKKK